MKSDLTSSSTCFLPISLCAQTSLSGSPSATSLCLVTPDGQRTMRTCLGASLELRSASQVASGWIAPGLQLLHCEGYNLYRPQLALAMAASAKVSVYATCTWVSVVPACSQIARMSLQGFEPNQVREQAGKGQISGRVGEGVEETTVYA